jgi:hypothetical protein
MMGEKVDMAGTTCRAKHKRESEARMIVGAGLFNTVIMAR